MVERIRAGHDGFGFDASSGKYGDMFEAGLIDPAKVVRVALANAVSVAGTLLLMEATMTDLPDKQANEERSPSTLEP